MSDWQPIETAPLKRDDPILLGHTPPDGWVCEGRWVPNDDGSDGHWYAANNHETDHWGGPIYPTHWQPLPAPPKETP